VEIKEIKHEKNHSGLSSDIYSNNDNIGVRAAVAVPIRGRATATRLAQFRVVASE
jgi:hypothetical protein